MSTPKLQSPKGTQDVLPSQTVRWQAVEQIARDTAKLFNFAEIRTPVFELSELFHRGVGEGSDMVRKETYDFVDRGGRNLTLRPEGTAGVVRAVIEHGLVDLPGARVKVFYLGPNFRYERPQKGRFHIHHQFGAEAFGVTGPEQDAEVILLQLEFYRRAGLLDLSLRLNSLGDRPSKQNYRDRLVEFLGPRRDALSEDSRRRLEDNPLRILDSKAPCDIEAIAGAPSAIDALTPQARSHFDRVCAILQSAGARFEVDARLVRGFDYYTGCVWEVTAAGLGSQSAVGGGGRYDNLVETLGGRPTPGVGFGCGLERLLLALESQNQSQPPPQPRTLVWLAHHGEAALRECVLIAAELRSAGIACDLDLVPRKIAAQFKSADRESARLCVVVGDDEIATATVRLKDLVNQQQQTVSRSQLVERLA